ncbi:MAG: TonB family protein [Thiomonas sp.]|uniref:energy transducer TonB n=1 Tax=Thiomonas sp. TaxID=2047785 RepID=UPI002A371BC6|nr:TonB family protein [Thiomonas sp.]MDY0329483.1 TonB family protein [Thiomonas sp.]
MMRNEFCPHAIGSHLSRPSWPVVLLVVAGLHLWLLVWARSLNPPPGTAAAPLQSPQVRWLQAAVLPAPKLQAVPQVDGTRTLQPRLQTPPPRQYPPHPTTAPPSRAPQRTPDPAPLPAPLPRNDTPTAEPPTAPTSPQATAPTTVKDNPATPATPPAAPTARATDGAPPGDAPSPAHLTAASDLAPPAAFVRPVDARQFGCDFPRPPYPRLARLRGESGTAVIHLTLAASGQIATAVVKRSSGSAALDAVALSSARAGHCTPGADARLATVPFHFLLDP